MEDYLIESADTTVKPKTVGEGEASFRSPNSENRKKVIMQNQLDLNEKEVDYYENIVDDLVNKLEKISEEKEELELVADALKERLNEVSREKEEQLNQLLNSQGNNLMEVNVSNLANFRDIV